ncbi:MAG: glycosyltransferase family 4 protein, partial [Gemmatimonadaceae bacterium]
FSGADNALFEELNRRGLLVTVVESQIPASMRMSLLVRTFRPSKRAWGNAWRRSLIKTPHAFAVRSAANDRVLRQRASEYDIVLQVSGLFAPFVGAAPRPVALFCDYTTKLAERNYTDWFGLREDEAAEWYTVETQLYSEAAVIFTASDNTRRSLMQDYRVASDRVIVVGEGVHHLPEYTQKDYSRPCILFIGIDFERKGGPWLLEDFRSVCARVPGAELHIVGPAARDPQPGVVWHGHLTDKAKLKQLFDTSTVLTLPSLCDPFGLALIEGMANRLPVVGTIVDAMPEIVQEGVTGYLVPPRDPQALADRLVQLLASPDLCEQMGTRGQQVVKERFMWDQVVDRVVDGLTDALRRSELNRDN